MSAELKALAILVVMGLALPVQAAVTVEAYYRLGDDDPGAVAGNIGNPVTVDSSGNGFDLSRNGVPQYSSDVPTFPTMTPVADTLSMRFDNPVSPIDTTGPTYVPSFYDRLSDFSVPTSYGIEAWVKSSTMTPVDPSGYAAIAYNGSPFATATAAVPNGVGFFQKGNNYIVRIGAYEKVLAPVSTTSWTHLAFLRDTAADTNDFYVNGLEEPDVTASTQMVPVAPSELFMIGGFPSTTTTQGDLFNGLIDDVRFFSCQTTGPIGFDPAKDLLVVVPEPSSLALTLPPLLLFLSFLYRRRRGSRERMQMN